MSDDYPEVNINFVTYLLNKSLSKWWKNPERKTDIPFVSIKVYDFEMKEKVRNRYDSAAQVVEDIVSSKSATRESKTVKNVWKKVDHIPTNVTHYSSRRKKPEYTLIEKITESRPVELMEHEKMIVDVSYVGNKLFYDDHCKIRHGACIRSTQDEFVEIEEKKEVDKVRINPKNDYYPLTLQFIINYDEDEESEEEDSQGSSDGFIDEDLLKNNDKTNPKDIGIGWINNVDTQEELDSIKFWLDDEHLMKSQLPEPRVIEVSPQVGLPRTMDGSHIVTKTLIEHWSGTGEDKDDIGFTTKDSHYTTMFMMMVKSGSSKSARNKVNSRLRVMGYTDSEIKTGRSCLSGSLSTNKEMDDNVFKWFNENKETIIENSQDSALSQVKHTETTIIPGSFSTTKDEDETKTDDTIIEDFKEEVRHADDQFSVGVNDKNETDDITNKEFKDQPKQAGDQPSSDDDDDIYKDSDYDDDDSEDDLKGIVIPNIILASEHTGKPSWLLTEERPITLNEDDVKASQEAEKSRKKREDEVEMKEKARKAQKKMMEDLVKMNKPINYDFLDD